MPPTIAATRWISARLSRGAGGAVSQSRLKSSRLTVGASSSVTMNECWVAGLLPRSPKATAVMVGTPAAVRRWIAVHSWPAPSTGSLAVSRFLKISPQPMPRWILTK
ncbi:hypothetical protein D3C81_1717050 [compost metagenome]